MKLYAEHFAPLWRQANKGRRAWYAIDVAEPRSCTVSFTDSAAIQHCVVVTASTLYEAVALAVRAFRQQGLLAEVHLGPATEFTVEVRQHAVRHTTSIARLEQRINAVGRGPKETLAKERVRDLLTDS